MAKARHVAASPAVSPALRLSASPAPLWCAVHSAASAAASPTTTAGSIVRRPTRTVVPRAVRTAIRSAVPAAARADSAATARDAAEATRPITMSTWRLVRSPVAHQVAKCSQLSPTGQ